MKTSIFVSGAAALVLLATMAQASPEPRVQAFLQRAEAKAQALAVAAGCNLDGQTLQVQARVGPEGRLTSVQVVGSTGSRDTDRALEQSLRHLQLADVPDELIDSKLTLVLGRPGATGAR